MPQPTNTFDSYDIAGLREDLSDVITNVDPDETPFYSKTKKVKTRSRKTEWQTDALRASGQNAHVEGDDTSADAVQPTVVLDNYTQIFKNAVVIPDTDEGLDKAGRGKEMLYQIIKTAKEQKLDIERALLANNAKVVGSSTVARELAGVATWLITTAGGGTGAVLPTGDGSDARGAGTNRTLNQTIFDGAMESIWNAGGKPDCVFLRSASMNQILGFTGSNSQRATIDASKTKVVNVTDVYMTPWGTVEFKMSREVPANSSYIMQSDKWEVANLRATKQKELGKTGDNTKRQIVTELTLKSLNEKASGGVFDIA